MNFFKPGLENFDTIKSYLKHNRFIGCEYSAANTVLWGEYYGTSLTIVDDMIAFCNIEDGKGVAFSYPIGCNSERKAFDSILKYFEENKLPPKFFCINEEMFGLIDSWYPGRFTIEYKEASMDYIYSTQKLASLSGKKLHAKRNHINRFIENNPNYEYSELTEADIEECIRLDRKWADEKETVTEEDKEYEAQAIEKALRNMDKLFLKGGVLRVNGEVIAFTIGEAINDKVFDVHFEKAEAQIQGAYAMINREFVRHAMDGYEYVNREEDLGLPGLRKAKASYYPDILYKKGFLTEK